MKKLFGVVEHIAVIDLATTELNPCIIYETSKVFTTIPNRQTLRELAENALKILKVKPGYYRIAVVRYKTLGFHHNRFIITQKHEI